MIMAWLKTHKFFCRTKDSNLRAMRACKVSKWRSRKPDDRTDRKPSRDRTPYLVHYVCFSWKNVQKKGSLPFEKKMAGGESKVVLEVTKKVPCCAPHNDDPVLKKNQPWLSSNSNPKSCEKANNDNKWPRPHDDDGMPQHPPLTQLAGTYVHSLFAANCHKNKGCCCYDLAIF